MYHDMLLHKLVDVRQKLLEISTKAMDYEVPFTRIDNFTYITKDPVEILMVRPTNTIIDDLRQVGNLRAYHVATADEYWMAQLKVNRNVYLRIRIDARHIRMWKIRVLVKLDRYLVMKYLMDKLMIRDNGMVKRPRFRMMRPEQIQEMVDWIKSNYKSLLPYVIFNDELKSMQPVCSGHFAKQHLPLDILQYLPKEVELYRDDEIHIYCEPMLNHPRMTISFIMNMEVDLRHVLRTLLKEAEKDDENMLKQGSQEETTSNAGDDAEKVNVHVGENGRKLAKKYGARNDGGVVDSIRSLRGRKRLFFEL